MNTIYRDKLPHLAGQVFVTGGAGFLGRSLLRRAFEASWPCQFTVFGRDEEKLTQAKYRWPDINIVIGDVRDYRHLLNAMRGHETVIHAAAIKFIPEAEHNVFETVKTNVEGSRNVANAAREIGVKQVIGISTDKACLPVNTYGMTKALMERMFAEANNWGSTRFVIARYGNVVGSTGSIVPVFQRQLAETGHVKVTDPNMTRFWLSPDEAIDLILLALGQSKTYPGCVFVPRCPAMRIGDLAAALSNGVPSDIIGSRPGEKVHEDLIHSQESIRVLDRGDYFIVYPAVSANIQGRSWTYSSHTPAGWVTPEHMLKMIADAATI
jgi:FlaA1/EpsC-like NDP-sugar epimerase